MKIKEVIGLNEQDDFKKNQPVKIRGKMVNGKPVIHNARGDDIIKSYSDWIEKFVKTDKKGPYIDGNVWGHVITRDAMLTGAIDVKITGAAQRISFSPKQLESV